MLSSKRGWGGRCDATNIIKPLVSVITSIGLDHTEILGSSIEAIAREKAGIIKSKVPVVVGPDVPFSLLKETADARGAPIYQSLFRHSDFDLENREIARLALKQLPFALPDVAIEEGLKKMATCRFERHVVGKKEVILDVAHNPHGFHRLLQKLELAYPRSPFRFIVGFSEEKEISACAKLIQEKTEAIHLVSGSHPRLVQAEELRTYFPKASVASSIKQAMQSALQESEITVVAGSFFIMADARKALGIQDVEDPTHWFDPTKTIHC